MEIARSQRQFAAYASDAECALRCFLQGERDQEFLEQALRLIHTYLAIPRPTLSPLPADEAVVRLALAIHQHVAFLGFWSQIVTLWPHLRMLAAKLSDPLLYAETTKHLAFVIGRRGDSSAATQLFVELMESANFANLPIYLQADILITAGTDAVWSGQLKAAERLLQRGYQAATTAESLETTAQLFEINGVRVSGSVMPQWENQAYALNQLGTLALFQADFARAHRHLAACLAIFVEAGQADNLACVAYQGLGRVLLHEGRYHEARAIWQRGLAIRQRRGEQEGIAVNSLYLAASELALGNWAEAERLLQTALLLFHELGNRLELAICHLYWGDLERKRGNISTACPHWRQALALMQTVSTPVIEQSGWLHALPWLFFHGEWQLAGNVLWQLWRSSRQQKLSVKQVLRLGWKKLRCNDLSAYACYFS